MDSSKACLFFLAVFAYFQDTAVAKWTNSLEYLVLGITPLKIIVSGFHICKLAVSFLLFLVDMCFFQLPRNGTVRKLWYIQGMWEFPCKCLDLHAALI